MEEVGGGRGLMRNYLEKVRIDGGGGWRERVDAQLGEG